MDKDVDTKPQPVDTYSVKQVAQILGRSESRVKQWIDDGTLPAAKEGKSWRLEQEPVHVLRQQMREQRDPDEAERYAEAAELRVQLNELHRELGRKEGRLELTEKADSTVREALEDSLRRERERADRLEAEIRDLRKEAQRSWWSRLWG